MTLDLVMVWAIAPKVQVALVKMDNLDYIKIYNIRTGDVAQW